MWLCWHYCVDAQFGTKRSEKKLDGSYPRMPRAVLNKSREQQPKTLQLYGHLPLPPSHKTIKVRQTRHVSTAVQVWTNP